MVTRVERDQPPLTGAIESDLRAIADPLERRQRHVELARDAWIGASLSFAVDGVAFRFEATPSVETRGVHRAFSVLPSRSPRTCFVPSAAMPRAMRMQCS